MSWFRRREEPPPDDGAGTPAENASGTPSEADAWAAPAPPEPETAPEPASSAWPEAGAVGAVDAVGAVGAPTVVAASGAGEAPPAVPGPHAEAVRPVTRERLEQCLRSQGYRYRVGSDGSLGGNWDGDSFSIDLIGPTEDVLQVRGTWHRTIEPELAPGIAHVLNDWNRDRIWPKVYTRPTSGGLLALTEVSVDVAAGATDPQITEVIACGLGTGVQFFASLTDLLATEKDLLPPE